LSLRSDGAVKFPQYNVRLKNNAPQIDTAQYFQLFGGVVGVCFQFLLRVKFAGDPELVRKIIQPQGKNQEITTQSIAFYQKRLCIMGIIKPGAFVRPKKAHIIRSADHFPVIIA